MGIRAKKDIDWRGDANRIVRNWPKPARSDLGDELMRVQLGMNPRSGSAMTDIGSGVSEIRLASRGESYRVIYVASIGSKVYVLHAFHKKSKSGKATPQKETNLAKQRYKELCAELAQTHSAPGRTQ